MIGPDFRRDPDSGLWVIPDRARIARAIRAGMPVDPTWRLDMYRFRNDDGTETTATFPVSEATNLTGVSVDSNVDVRLRAAIDQYEGTAANADDPEIVPRLEFKIPAQSVAWQLVSNDAAGTYVEMDSGSGLSDGSATSDLAGEELTLTYTRSTGYQEENSSDATTLTYTTETTLSYVYEWAFTLLSGGLLDLSVIYFRVTDAGVLLDTYDYGDASDTNPITIAVTKTASVADPLLGALGLLGVGK